MKNDPILVVGTGRSGTSSVARILHKNFKVFMGSRFRKSDDQNPLGYYEDTDFNTLNSKLLLGMVPFNEWQIAIDKLIKKRQKLNRLWGIKDPRFAHLLGLYFVFFMRPKIIRCIRDKELVINSLMKYYEWDRKQSELLYYTREANLDRLLIGRNRDVLNIRFDSDYISDESLVRMIGRRFFEKNKVYLAILNKGWLRREIIYKMLPQMTNTPGVEVVWENPNLTYDHPIFSNRNQIRLRFLQTDCTHLLMIDDDVIPYDNPIPYVWADKDIIGFPAKVRQHGQSVNWVAYMKHPSTQTGYSAIDFGVVDDDVDLIKCDAIGTGCILIKRKVLEKLESPFTILIDDNGVCTMGTDFAFCKKATENGFEVYSSTKLVCEHVKETGLLDITAYDDSDYRDRSIGIYKIPWGDMSITQKDWHFIRDIIDDIKPKKILEFGAGLSSLLMSEKAKVISYETNTKWARHIRKKRTDRNKLIIRKWNGKNIKEKNLDGFDLVFVDGPPSEGIGGPGRQYSISLASKLSDRIIIHDSNRQEERLWQDKYLRPHFKCIARNGHHQSCSTYWIRRDLIKTFEIDLVTTKKPKKIINIYHKNDYEKMINKDM